MPILPPTLVAKLDPLIRRLASIHDGEVVATARAIERRLRAERFDLNDLAETVRRQAPPLAPQQPQPAWREMRSFCLQHRSRLSARELRHRPRQVARQSHRQAIQLAQRDPRAAECLNSCRMPRAGRDAGNIRKPQRLKGSPHG
jgi:hypothetical protein